jgi:Tfp pilus assembly PilM family ATPase
VLRPRTKTSAIAFDVGAAGVRACQLVRRNGRLQLRDSLVLERSAAGESDELALPPLDATQLERLMARGAFQGRDIALVLSPPEAQFYPMRLPGALLEQSRERIEQALKCEVAQESRKNADLEVRFWALPAGRGQQPNVMAAVMPAETAAQWCDLAQQQGLHLRRIDVSPCALVALACRAAAPAEDEIWGVLDLGLRHSVLTVVIGAVPAYVRVLSVAAHDWTCQLAQAFEVDYGVAEQLKREHGVGSPGCTLRHTDEHSGPGLRKSAPAARSGVGLLNATDLTTAVSTVLRKSVKVLALEVGRCFSYVLQSYPNLTLSRLFLAGGGAACPGLATALETALDLPVRVIGTDPTRSPQPEAADRSALAGGPSPQSAAAIGGALLELESS